MSAEEKSPLDLTGLDFGPAWAKDEKPIRDYSKEVGPREGRDRRGGGGGGPRRDGGKGRGQNDRRNSNNNDRRNSDRRGSSDRRNSDRRQSGGGRNDNRRGRDQRERPPQVPAPEGFLGSVMPVEEGLDNLSREIQAGGRTYSVFDLARVVMGARERFNVTFEAPKGKSMFRCKSDGSIWLSKEEAVAQFWRANLLPELYEEIEIEVEAPKGSFNSIAKCGLSGEWLGPPNYHSYPTAVASLHAERFSHMSLDDYKRRIRTESGEEVVAAWQEAMTKQIRFRPLSTKEILALREQRKAAEQAAKKKESEKESGEEAKAEASPEATAETPVQSEAAEVEKAAPTEEVATPEANAEAAPEPTAEATEQPTAEETPDEPKAADLIDRRDLERHFIDNHFKQLFAEVERAWVPGSIAGKLLSPALLSLLKDTVAEERRYPSKLTPVLCRQLSGRHLAVFKWKKKLKAGPARPHAIPDDLKLADRPQQLLDWIEANSSKSIDELWKECLPAEADEELKRAFYHDLHWLLNQGYVLLMADSSVHLAKARTPATPPAQEKKAPADATSKTEKPAPTTETPKEDAPAAEAPKEEPKTEEAQSAPATEVTAEKADKTEETPAPATEEEAKPE